MSQGSPSEFVHVVFKTHLDLGFTDYAREVVAAYFENYIPRALDLARRTREAGGDRFVWTTGSWLIYEYLEWSSEDARRRMEEGIAAGDILWHGLPFTTHSELMDAALFRHGLGLSAKLDRRFGKRTIAAKMTDVPGHTRAIVPFLAEAGIEFLHLGVNPASMPPDVPPVFVWRHTDGSSVLVMLDKDGYGGTSLLPFMNEALAFGHTGDNLGPQRDEEIAEFYDELRRTMPKAEIAATSLDAVATSLQKVRDRLPIVEDEIGDTWIHGVGTDPTKVRRYLALRRWYSAHAKIDRLDRFADKLMLIPEHTWGMDVKLSGPNRTFAKPVYEIAEFQKRRAVGEFSRQEASWSEQRDYLEEAIKAGQEAQVAPLPLVDPERPVVVKGTLDRIENESIRVDFGPDWRPLRLVDKRTGKEWSLGDSGTVLYETFGSDQYDAFEQAYNPRPEETAPWALPDFTKPGLEEVLRQGTRSALRSASGTCDGTRAWIAMESVGGGCPDDAWLEWKLEDDTLFATVGWQTKAANRLPEAIWFLFGIPAASDEGFRVVKLGQEIDPTNVVSHGARRNHAVESIRHESGYEITPFDSALVSVGEPGLLRFDDSEPRPSAGFAWNLYNNVWGTNFPIWFDEPAIFRFALALP